MRRELLYDIFATTKLENDKRVELREQDYQMSKETEQCDFDRVFVNYL